MSYVSLAGVLARERDLCRNRRSSFSMYHPQKLGVGHCNTYTYQAAKDVRASKGILMDLFERMEMFFRRLEIYTEVPPTPEMMETIIQIMVEILSILGIATKEIKQGRTSEQFMSEQVCDH